MSEEKKKKRPPLTPEQQRRCELGLRIAEAAARQAANRFRVDKDTLLSRCYEGLVVVAGTFDPSKSPNGENGWGPYAVQNIRRYVLKLFAPYNRARHNLLMDRPLPDGAEKLYADPKASKVDEELLNREENEELKKRMKRLTPIQRWVVELRARGYLLKEIGELLNRTAECCRRHYENGMTKLRLNRSRGLGRNLKRWMEESPEKYKRVLTKGRRKGGKKSAKNRAYAAKLRRLSGKPYPRLWYSVDRTNRTITGPYELKREAAGLTGTGLITAAGEGWRHTSAGRARFLEALLDGGADTVSLAEKTGVKRQAATDAMLKLSRRGLTVRVGDVWHLAPGVCKGEPLELLRGRECVSLYEAGYRMTPGR